MSGASLAEAASARVARPPAVAVAGRLGVLARVVGLGVAVFILAFAVRVSAIDAYVTIDESRWVQRASDFWALMDQGNLEDTFIIGHPGVTTMWTALVGMGPERARHFSYLEGRADATRRDGYFEALTAARRPFAAVAALGVAGVALLGWRLLGPGPAVVGGLLLAFEPFLVAHARVAHLDSSLTTYAALTALSAMVYFAAGGSWPYLLLSGAGMGLAFLTKAPSVYLVGFVPLVAGLMWLTSNRTASGLLRTAARLVAWAAIAAGVGVLLWPALRVDPLGTVLKMAQFTERVGGGEHDNYFLGQVTDDPGLLFYPFVLVLRLAPLTLLGVLAVAFLWRRLAVPHRRVVLLLTLYGLGFMAMMTLGPKKFDRYLLPVFPVLGLVSGLGIWTLAGALARRRRVPDLPPAPRPGAEAGPADPAVTFRGTPCPVLLVALLAVAIQAGTLLPVFRYPLSFYSPLLGGGWLADRLVLVGWGEGLDRVAAWIDQQPRPLGEPTVATSYHRVLQAQLRGSAVPLEHVRMADFVVPYVNTVQRGDEAEVLAPYLTSGRPEHTVTINGIEYARVYRGPHYPVTLAPDAELGSRATLIRAIVAPGSGTVRPAEEVTVGLRWDRPATGRERVVVGIVGSDGRIVVQDDRPLGADGPDEHGLPGDLHRLTIPPRTPPGSYRLSVRVLEAQGRPALSVTRGPSAGHDGGSPDTVLLRDFVVERAP